MLSGSISSTKVSFMTNLICFENVTKTYQMGEVTVRALRSVSPAVSEGEFVMIMGPSGSGKSTALNLMGGLDRPTSGQVIVNGETISDFDNPQMTRYRRDTVGIVFQFFNLIPTLTASENVELALTLRPNHTALRRRSRELLDRVGLAERADHFPAQLSGGEQQRVAIEPHSYVLTAVGILITILLAGLPALNRIRQLDLVQATKRLI